MFQIFNKKYDKPLFQGFTDMHNHVLPGIDDGSKSVAISEEMFKLYETLGFSKVIPTSHIYQELYPNTPETINTAFNTLKEADTRGLLADACGAEYMVDETFLKSIEIAPPAMSYNDGYVLVEMHFFGQTAMIEEVCFVLSQQNLKPILAHPERYQLVDKLDQFKELKNKGFYLQLNALSLMGHYGPKVKTKAEKLLVEGLYDFVGTDAHHPGHLQQLTKLKLTKKQGLQWESITEHQKLRFK
jgi:protein-tyrosine phosphatase